MGLYSLAVTSVHETWFRARVWYRLYGSRFIFLHAFACSQVWCMIHQLLEEPEQKGFDVFRSSQAYECAAVAVAGTVTASISVASMQLYSPNDTYSVVSALWLFSVVTGLFAVLCACNQQVTVARCIRMKDLWSWMNDGHRENNTEQAKSGESCEGTSRQKFIVPCYYASLTLSIPKVLIHYSLNMYMVGMAVFLGLRWISPQGLAEKDGAVADSENIFIFFICMYGILFPLYWISNVANRCKDMPYKRKWRRLKGDIVGVTELWLDEKLAETQRKEA